jgi:hypothetical protein
MATDSFTRPDGALGANWTVEAGSVVIASHAATSGTLNVSCQAIWTANSFTNDQSSEVTFVSIGSGSFAGPLIRYTTGGGGNFYFVSYGQGAGNLNLFKVIAGSQSALATTAFTVNNGDKLGIEATGTTITVKVNGVVKQSVSDSSLATGSPGMIFFDPSVHTSISPWTGTSLSVSTKASFFIMT